MTAKTLALVLLVSLGNACNPTGPFYSTDAEACDAGMIDASLPQCEAVRFERGECIRRGPNGGVLVCP